MIPFRRAALAVARRELRRERRRGTVAWVTIPFGVVALLLVPLAVGTEQVLLRRIGPGLYWVVVLLFGVLVAVGDHDGRSQRDATALLGIDPVAELTGRALAATLLLLGFELATGVAAVVLYDLPVVGLPQLVVVMVLVAAGLGLLGTVAGAVAGAGPGAALVPLLVAPLAVPLLLGATQTLDGFVQGRSTISWILMMIVAVTVSAVVVVVAAAPLQEGR